jgi:hypothetical protein
MEAACPAGEQLVRIGLVADIPDETVARELEHAVKSDGQLYDTKRTPEVTAIGRHSLYDPLTDFPGQRLQARQRPTPDLPGVAHSVQQAAHDHILGVLFVGLGRVLVWVHKYYRKRGRKLKSESHFF